jgi:hypothetical protein
MIDVMTLRQFYERREITEMIWIHDINNSVDSMIKTKSSSTLKTMIDINKINLNIIEWMKRARKTINQNKRRYDATSRVARHDTTSRVASLITWLTLDEHYI